MFMVFKFFYCVFGEYKSEGSEIISFFCLNFACHETIIHETMIKTQGNFIFVPNDSHCDEPNKRSVQCTIAMVQKKVQRFV